MTENDDLQRMLRSAFPPVGRPEPYRDRWMMVVQPAQPETAMSWVDLSALLIVATGMLVVPEWLWLVALLF